MWLGAEAIFIFKILLAAVPLSLYQKSNYVPTFLQPK